MFCYSYAALLVLGKNELRGCLAVLSTSDAHFENKCLVLSTALQNASVGSVLSGQQGKIFYYWGSENGCVPFNSQNTNLSISVTIQYIECTGTKHDGSWSGNLLKTQAGMVSVYQGQAYDSCRSKGRGLAFDGEHCSYQMRLLRMPWNLQQYFHVLGRGLGNGRCQ